MKIGDKVRETRLNLGLTQVQFADKLNLSDNYISLVESGKKTPSIKFLDNIYDTFGVDILYVLENAPGVKEIREKYSAQEIDSIILGLESIVKKASTFTKSR